MRVLTLLTAIAAPTDSTDLDMTPMPSVPALPPAAPSFAERLSAESRPHTAASKSMIELPWRENMVAAAAAASPATPPPEPRSAASDRPLEMPLAPPLPLLLRPPLRKKKSFSRVSNWLFPGNAHQRDISLDSLTNLPKPVTGKEGFYQSVAPWENERRISIGSASTPSSWTTEEEEDNTVQTGWSPGSTPLTRQALSTPNLDPTATFGRGGQGNGRGSVGVAF